jgi:hypothetical protein
METRGASTPQNPSAQLWDRTVLVASQATASTEGSLLVLLVRWAGGTSRQSTRLRLVTRGADESNLSTKPVHFKNLAHSSL